MFCDILVNYCDRIINGDIYSGMSEKGVTYGFGLPLKSYEYVWENINVTAFDYGPNFKVYLKNGKVIYTRVVNYQEN